MMQALLISNLVLWILLLILAGLLFALMRQVGLLHERVSPAGALVASRGPVIGKAAPQVEVETIAGESLAIGSKDPGGIHTLLLFVSPTCPICKIVLPIADSLEASITKPLRIILASDGPLQEHTAFIREFNLGSRRYVLSRELGLGYQVGQLPYAFVIDADGTLRAHGMVNTREHLESLFEAWDRGVPSLQEYVARTKGEERVA